jgi:hypothetical protein
MTTSTEAIQALRDKLRLSAAGLPVRYATEAANQAIETAKNQERMAAQYSPELAGLAGVIHDGNLPPLMKEKGVPQLTITKWSSPARDHYSLIVDDQNIVCVSMDGDSSQAEVFNRHSIGADEHRFTLTDLTDTQKPLEDVKEILRAKKSRIYSLQVPMNKSHRPWSGNASSEHQFAFIPSPNGKNGSDRVDKHWLHEDLARLGCPAFQQGDMASMLENATVALLQTE